MNIDYLTDKEKAYCHYRAVGYNQTESVKMAGYDVNDDSARALGSKMELKVDIRQGIQEEKVNNFQKSMITEEYILSGIKEIAEHGDKDANRLRAWELLGKTRAMFKDHTITEDISDNDDFESTIRTLGLKNKKSDNSDGK